MSKWEREAKPAILACFETPARDSKKKARLA